MRRTKPPLNSYTKGLLAEIYAMGFLFLKGYRIRAWRYKTPVGEVDIIASHGKDLVFIEVKARKNIDTGLGAILPNGKKRITRAAGHFLSENPRFSENKMRFDVIVIAGFRLRHLDKAWNCPT